MYLTTGAWVDGRGTIFVLFLLLFVVVNAVVALALAALNSTLFRAAIDIPISTYPTGTLPRLLRSASFQIKLLLPSGLVLLPPLSGSVASKSLYSFSLAAVHIKSLIDVGQLVGA